MRKKPRMIEEIEHGFDERTAPSRPGNRKYARRASGHNVAALRAEQEAETAQPVTGGGPEHMTSGQWRGMVLGGLTGAVIGALLALPFGFIPFMGSLAARLAVLALCGAMAGAAAGGVYWGGRLPELEGETVDVEGRPSSGTTLRDPHTDERGR
jgi:hypothetical protein